MTRKTTGFWQLSALVMLLAASPSMAGGVHVSIGGHSRPSHRHYDHHHHYHRPHHAPRYHRPGVSFFLYERPEPIIVAPAPPPVIYVPEPAYQPPVIIERPYRVAPAVAPVSNDYIVPAPPVPPQPEPVIIRTKGRTLAGPTKGYVLRHHYTGEHFEIQVPAWCEPRDVDHDDEEIELQYDKGEIEITCRRDGSVLVDYDF